MKRLLTLISLVSLLFGQNIALAAPKPVVAQQLSIAVHTPQIMAAGTNILPGAQNVTFARIDIKTAANNGISINKIGFSMIGTSAASTALSNLRLVDLQGRVVGAVAAPFANNTFVIMTNRLNVNANSMLQLDVVANVTAQARVGTLGVAVDYMGVTNPVTAQKSQVAPTPAAIKKGTLANILPIAVAAGELTLSMNAQGLDGTLVPGAVGEVIGRMDMRASNVEDILVNQIDFSLNGRDEALRNLRLSYIDNAGQEVAVGGVIPVLIDNQTYSFQGFNSTITVRRGTTMTFVVKADVSPDARAGESISLVYNTLMRPVGAASASVVRVNANLPMVWPAQTVTGPEITASLSPLVMPAQSARRGENHVLVGNVQISVGSEDVMLNELTFTSSTNILTNLSIVKVSTGQLIARTAALDANNRARFSNIIQLLGRNTHTTYAVYADILPAGQGESPAAFSVGIQNGADIRAVGAFSGENVNIRSVFPLWSRAVLIAQ